MDNKNNNKDKNKVNNEKMSNNQLYKRDNDQLKLIRSNHEIIVMKYLSKIIYNKRRYTINIRKQIIKI